MPVRWGVGASWFVWAGVVAGWKDVRTVASGPLQTLVGTVTKTRTAALAQQENPLSLVTLEEQTTVGQDTTVSLFDAATRTRTVTSPEGRVSTTRLDGFGRPVEVVTPGALPLTGDHV